MTYEVKQQILDDYNDRSIKVQDIQAKYHISGKDLMSIIIEMGGATQTP